MGKIRPGQEVWTIHESGTTGADLHDARTGQIIFRVANNTGGEGPGRGVAGDIYAGNPGAESGVASNNGTKATPALSADILGDWREEVIWRTSDNRALRIYSTTDATGISRPSLMQDRQYRVAVAWQNTAYNQPPHPSFTIG